MASPEEFPDYITLAPEEFIEYSGKNRTRTTAEFLKLQIKKIFDENQGPSSLQKDPDPVLGTAAFMHLEGEFRDEHRLVDSEVTVVELTWSGGPKTETSSTIKIGGNEFIVNARGIVDLRNPYERFDGYQIGLLMSWLSSTTWPDSE
jgi:hypothetical protein